MGSIEAIRRVARLSGLPTGYSPLTRKPSWKTTYGLAMEPSFCLGLISGTGSIIAANSVVNGTIPKYCTAAGIPAEPIKKYDWTSNSWVRAYKESSKVSYEA